MSQAIDDSAPNRPECPARRKFFAFLTNNNVTPFAWNPFVRRGLVFKFNVLASTQSLEDADTDPISPPPQDLTIASWRRTSADR
jgi:hypothetical protein